MEWSESRGLSGGHEISLFFTKPSKGRTLLEIKGWICSKLLTVRHWAHMGYDLCFLSIGFYSFFLGGLCLLWHIAFSQCFSGFSVPCLICFSVLLTLCTCCLLVFLLALIQ
jgi:hypothetical protein